MFLEDRLCLAPSIGLVHGGIKLPPLVYKCKPFYPVSASGQAGHLRKKVTIWRERPRVTASRNHCEDSTDWVALEIPRAGGYRIETSELEAEADTVLALYDVDGVTLLAENDDAGNRKPESRIDWSFAQAGTYYVEVGARNRGPAMGYWLGLTPVKGRVK